MPKQTGNITIGELTAAAITGIAAPGEARLTMGRKGIPILGSVPLFAGLSRRHLARIANLAEEVQYPAGRVVVQAGTAGKAFFIIVSSRATVYKGVVPTGRALAHLGLGDFFGEMALLDGGPRSATLVPEDPVLVIRLSRGLFQNVVDDEPPVAFAVMRELAGRVRRGAPSE